MNESKTQPPAEGVITSPPATCSAAAQYLYMVAAKKSAKHCKGLIPWERVNLATRTGFKRLARWFISQGIQLPPKEPGRDESECAPYWLCYALAQYVCDLNIACEREPCSCDQSSLCITEWCEPCAAKAWLQEQKRLSAPLPPNDPSSPHCRRA